MFGPMPTVHSALVACSLNLLTGCISSQFPDLVHVLLAHPKVQFTQYDLIKMLFNHSRFQLKQSLSKANVFMLMYFFFFYFCYSIS